MNLGYVFNREYFKDESGNYIIKKKSEDEKEKILDNKNRQIIASSLLKKADITSLYDMFNSEHSLLMKVSYSGLYVGGLSDHGVGIDNEIKLGFNFDYTTGLPIISGASVKGKIKYAFKKDKYIKELIKEVTKTELNNTLLTALTTNIFDCGDIFFDAIVNIEENIKRSQNKRILEIDYLTPHESPLKGPKPLKFLKIPYDTMIKFQFDLNDFEIEDIKITAMQKLEIFRRILLDFGMGAKTNVGFGYFDEEYSNNRMKERKEKIKQTKEKEFMKNASEAEKLIYILEKEKGTDKYDNLVNNAINNELENLEGEEQKKLARYIKDYLIFKKKWNVQKKKKQNKKYKRVIKIKTILEEI